MDEGGFFGNWAADEDGLPCFDLETAPPDNVALVLPCGDRRRAWHQVGNDRVTATAHAGGWTSLYASEGGFIRLNGVDPDHPDELGGMWAVRVSQGRDLLSPFTQGAAIEARWGTGYA